jgi:hypothetical protein
MAVTYQVLKQFTDVRGAVHRVGETISDLTIVSAGQIRDGYVQIIPDVQTTAKMNASKKTLERRVEDLEEIVAENSLTEEPDL